MPIRVVARLGHLIFITFCLATLAAIHLPPHNSGCHNRDAEKTIRNRKADLQEQQPSLSVSKALEQEQQHSKTAAALPAAPVIDAEGDSFVDTSLEQLPQPDVEFTRAMLAGWDNQAEKLINQGNMDGLIELKMRLTESMPKETRLNFLKADCNASLSESHLALKDPTGGVPAYKYMYQYEASLEALHRLAPDDPFYFFGKSFLHLRHRNEPHKALNLAQQGLTLLRRNQNVTVWDIFYDWKLTQIKAICLSISGRGDEAINSVLTCQKRIEKLPGEQSSLARETSMVIDRLRQGKKFSRLLWQGKLTN